MDGRKAWFAPKRYGLGSGRPVAWQGWILLLAYLALVAATGVILEGSGWAQAAIILAATIALVIVSARTTRGGWRWRWGGEE